MPQSVYVCVRRLPTAWETLKTFTVHLRKNASASVTRNGTGEIGATMTTDIPDKYRAESLVRAGFTPGDAEKVEAFARRLAANGEERSCSCSDADSLFCEGAEYSGTGECECLCHDAGKRLDTTKKDRE